MPRRVVKKAYSAKKQKQNKTKNAKQANKQTNKWDLLGIVRGDKKYDIRMSYSLFYCPPSFLPLSLSLSLSSFCLSHSLSLSLLSHSIIDSVPHVPPFALRLQTLHLGISPLIPDSFILMQEENIAFERKKILERRSPGNIIFFFEISFSLTNK